MLKLILNTFQGWRMDEHRDAHEKFSSSNLKFWTFDDFQKSPNFFRKFMTSCQPCILLTKEDVLLSSKNQPYLKKTVKI